MWKKLLISSASILISSAALAFATPARADFVVCNKAAGRAYVAVSWTDQQDVTWSRGWLQLDPGNCGTALRGRVNNANIGVYAETPTGVVASGNTRRCVIWVQVQSSWNIRDAANATRCRGNGREMKPFEMNQTGNSPNYTYEVYD